MFTIGEFSRLARVSCRLLRHYDQLGLVAPDYVDEDNGYRYYTASQLSRLNRILVLKELGFRLDAIAPLLDTAVDPAELRERLAAQRREVADAIDREAARLRHIEARIAQLDEAGRFVDDDVVVRAEPARTLFALRTTCASFAEAKATLVTVAAAIDARLPKRALGRLTVFAHAETFEPDDLDLELGYFVDGPHEPIVLADGRRIEARPVAAVERMAVCVRIGPPENAHVTTARIARLVEQRGDHLEAPSREVFVAPFDAANPASAVVEMQFPLRAASVS